MVWRIPVANSAAAYTLNNGDNLYIANPIILGGISAVGADQHVEIDGTIATQNGDGLYFSKGTASGNTAVVHEDGVIKSFNNVGFTFYSTNSTLTNDGSIFGGGFAGVFLGDGSASNVGTTTVNNSGSITSKQLGVARWGDGDIIVLNNSGIISGDQRSFGTYQGTSYDGTDKITNSGTMIGQIDLSLGDDTYDGRDGTVQGMVYGGGGSDKLYGGSEKNTLAGGEGNDKLFGGKGDDTFLFDTALNAATNVDKIIDFSSAKGNNDRFNLVDTAFAALSAGKLGDDAFHLGTKAGDKEDRILYDKKHGDLYFDGDGSVKTLSPIKFAEVKDNTVLTHSDFYVIHNDIWV